MRQGSGTCSSTLEEKQTSTEASRSGMSSALPSTAPSGTAPSRAIISPASQSTHSVRAPWARSTSVKYPGPPPTSATSAPGRPVYVASWAAVSRASMP